MYANLPYQNLLLDLNISGDNSITICNTRSIILLVDMRQPGVGVVIEGDVVDLLGLGPLLNGGVSSRAFSQSK